MLKCINAFMHIKYSCNILSHSIFKIHERNYVFFLHRDHPHCLTWELSTRKNLLYRQYKMEERHYHVINTQESQRATGIMVFAVSATTIKLNFSCNVCGKSWEVSESGSLLFAQCSSSSYSADRSMKLYSTLMQVVKHLINIYIYGCGC